MEKRDFLLREIEKLTQLIRKLLGIIESISLENFEIKFSEINNKLVDFFGFSFENLSTLEDCEFIKLIKDIDETNLELLSILILETIKKLQSTTNNYNIKTEELAKKGIVLIDYIDDKSKTFSMNRINLKKELLQYH